MTQFLEWLRRKWAKEVEVTPEDFEQAFVASPSGRRVLEHLLDKVYCQVYMGKDPYECTAHNARRSVVHEILVQIDRAEHSDKYAAEQKRPAPWDVRKLGGIDGRVSS